MKMTKEQMQAEIAAIRATDKKDLKDTDKALKAALATKAGKHHPKFSHLTLSWKEDGEIVEMAYEKEMTFDEMMRAFRNIPKLAARQLKKIDGTRGPTPSQIKADYRRRAEAREVRIMHLQEWLEKSAELPALDADDQSPS